MKSFYNILKMKKHAEKQCWPIQHNIIIRCQKMLMSRFKGNFKKGTISNKFMLSLN